MRTLRKLKPSLPPKIVSSFFWFSLNRSILEFSFKFSDGSAEIIEIIFFCLSTKNHDFYFEKRTPSKKKNTPHRNQNRSFPQNLCVFILLIRSAGVDNQVTTLEGGREPIARAFSRPSRVNRFDRSWSTPLVSEQSESRRTHRERSRGRH